MERDKLFPGMVTPILPAVPNLGKFWRLQHLPRSNATVPVPQVAGDWTGVSSGSEEGIHEGKDERGLTTLLRPPLRCKRDVHLYEL